MLKEILISIFLWSFFLPVFLSPNTTHADEKFTIGLALPLTGELAEYGIAEKNGFELARSDHPELFKHIRFLYDDTRYDSAQSVSIFNRLRERTSLVYLWGYGPGQAVAPLAELHKFPLFALSSEQGLAKGRQFTVVGYAFYTRQAALLLLKYLRSNGWKRFGILKTEIAFFNSILDEMKILLKDDESLEIVDTFGNNDTDFKTSISKLRNKKYDAVGIFLLGGQAVQFFNQIAQMRLSLKTFGTDTLDSSTLVEQAKGNMEGLVFEAPYFDPKFAKRYKDLHGNDAQVAWAAHAYEFALLTARLFGGESQRLSGEQILERYRTAGKQTGVTGKYEYKESSDGSGFGFKVVMRKVQENGIVELTD